MKAYVRTTLQASEAMLQSKVGSDEKQDVKQVAGGDQDYAEVEEPTVVVHLFHSSGKGVLA